MNSITGIIGNEGVSTRTRRSAGSVLIKVCKSPLRAYFYFYYWIKIKFLAMIAGEEAIAYVLHDSFFPDIVLRLGGAKIGTDVRVQRWLTLHETRGTFRNLEIGDGVFIGKNVLIDLTNKVKIGSRSGIGMNSIIITHSNFGRSCLSESYPPSSAPVEIMEDCGIGWGCLINKGTQVSPRVILLPGAVVTGMLPEDSTFGGNPARRIVRTAWERAKQE